MKQHRLIFLQTVSFCFSLLAMSLDGFSQKPSAVPLDSLITVGYATGNIKNLSGSVEKITELQMNRDQILNPLDAIRGRVPGLTIQKGTTARPLWMPSACAERPRLPVATIL